MNKHFNHLLILLLTIVAASESIAQSRDLLGVPDPLQFDDINYNLLLAKKINEFTYYQEYLPDNETSDDYNQMISCKVFLTDWAIRAIAENKMRQVNDLERTDSICRPRMFERPDGQEFIVDYFLGEYSSQGKLSMVDYYVCRYSSIKLENDSTAVLAYIYTRHSNGKKPERFLEDIKSKRNDYVKTMGSAELPAIKKLLPNVDYIKDPSKEPAYSSVITPSHEQAKNDFLMGASFNANHQFDKAIEKFKMAIAIDSTGNCGTGMDGAAYGELGHACFKSGDYVNAIFYLDKGIAINKYYPLTYQHKVEVLAAQNKPEEAIRTLDLLISYNPDEPMAYVQRGLLYEEGKSDMALKDFNTCLNLIKEQNLAATLNDVVKIVNEQISQIEQKAK